jgi:site-specific DNA recombinase
MKDIATERPRRKRCAVYTRKSSEEGLDMAFNSLDAQREACEAYILSQKAEGWVLIKDTYDDGGISGGTLERPGLQRLLADIEDGFVDVVVVYKIDRLSRSLMDFSRLVEAFERNDVTFVSVTQSFNTTSSMGRLTLNILLSFAQFEREVIGERIRDKVAASRKRGIWMGGYVPMGYDAADRKLVINAEEAAQVRRVFGRFVELGSATVLTQEMRAAGLRNKRGRLIDKGIIYRMLGNRVYIGEAVHKGQSYPGEHDAIISKDLWDQVRAIMQTSPRARAANTRAKTPALLKGLIFTDTGAAMTPTFTRKGSKQYRYYISMDLVRNREASSTAGARRLPAGMIEEAVIGELRSLLRTPEIATYALQALRRDAAKISEAEVVAALSGFDDLWRALFPAEQTRIIQLLVRRATVTEAGLVLDLRSEGIPGLIREMLQRSAREPA